MATNQSSRKNRWNITKYQPDHGRASRQTYLSSMVPTTRVPSTCLQLTAILFSLSWIYWCPWQPEWLLTSWNLIWQDMVFLTDSPQTTKKFNDQYQFEPIKYLHSILNPMGRLRTVPQQEPLPHYPWLVTCLSQKSFPMYTRICNIGTPSKRSPSTQVLKELQPLRHGDVVLIQALPLHSDGLKHNWVVRKLHTPINYAERMAESTAKTVHILTKFLRTFKRCQTKT